MRDGQAHAYRFGLVLTVSLGLPSAVAQPTRSEPLAEVNGGAITAKDLEGALGTKLTQADEQLYNLKRQGVEALITQRLLVQEAARLGTSDAALLDAEVKAKAEPLSERGDETAARETARTRLQRQRLSARRAEYVESLWSKATVPINLQRPPVVRVAVSTDAAPLAGPPKRP
jgi:hypothetical protein